MDCSPPGFSVHGILQARMLEWVAVPFSRGSSQPRDHTDGQRSLAGLHCMGSQSQTRLSDGTTRTRLVGVGWEDCGGRYWWRGSLWLCGCRRYVGAVCCAQLCVTRNQPVSKGKSFLWLLILCYHSLPKESEVTLSCPNSATPWTVPRQAPGSVGFSRQEYWEWVS